MWHDAVLVAGKDLRIEARSRVGLWQVVPFALLVLVLLAFAIGPGPGGAAPRRAGHLLGGALVLDRAGHSAQRRRRVGRGHPRRAAPLGHRPGRHLPRQGGGDRPQLLALQVVLWAGVTFLFDVRVHVIWLAVVASLLATVGLAAAGVLYGAMSAGLRVRDTLLPLLVLPVLAPVLLAGSKIWQAAISGNVSSGTQWLKILVPFAAIYLISASSCTGHYRRPREPDRVHVSTAAVPRRCAASWRRGGAAALAPGRRRSRRADPGRHRLVGPVGHPAGRGPGQLGAAALHPSRRRHGGPVLGGGSRARRQPALPVAADPLLLLGPPGRLRRRGRRGVLRPDPRHGLAVGSAGLGRVVDLGRPADLDRAAAAPRARLPGAAPRAGRSAHPSPPLRRRRHPDRDRRARWCTSRWTGGTRCTRAARSSTPGSSSTSTAPCSGRCCSASSPSRSSSSGCLAVATGSRCCRTRWGTRSSRSR